MGVTVRSMAEDSGPLLGRSVVRLSSERHVRGGGRFTSDVHHHGQRHVAILRSPHAHARIRSIDTKAAAMLPGVDLVVTGADTTADTEPLFLLWDLPGQRGCATRCLAHGTVRWVGEGVAAVVAVDRATAEDALELIEVDYEPLAAVMTPAEATAAGSPVLYEDWPDNTAHVNQWVGGDVAAAFERADIVVTETFHSGRMYGLPLEARAVSAVADSDGLTVWTSTQSPHQVRRSIAESLGLPQHQVRVIAPDVGGGFGTKGAPYGEDTLVAYLARRTGRPVIWVEDRAEAVVASAHARDIAFTVEMGFLADGTISGLRARGVADLGGAVSSAGMCAPWASGATMPGPYKIADVDIEMRAVVTNKAPLGAFRGVGQAEGNFPLERAIELGARRLGLDPAEVRRRNLVDTMPYFVATGLLLDSGDYPALLQQVLDRFDWDGTQRRCAEARAEGRLLGAGLACYAEATNFGPSRIITAIGTSEAGFDTTTIRIEPDGRVRVLMSMTPMGNGVETTVAQTVADTLGVPLDDVAVITGDTWAAPFRGYASGGSAGAGIGGSSALVAAGKAKEKTVAIAAHLLEAAPGDLEVSGGRFSVRGTPTRSVTMGDVARAAYLTLDLPEGMEPGLEVIGSYDPLSVAFSYGAVAVLVEVCRETGRVHLHRVVFGHDCGTVLNPAIVEGQIEGGVAQGIGAALYEAIPYDESGQPKVALLLDYPLPLAPDVPVIEQLHTETPSPLSLNGAKGVGESGTIPTPAAVANAVAAALGADAPPLTSVPVRPEWILEALEDLDLPQP
ncbi:MAG: xanthine dehydrogenase family protein molybdopterin-binding subunit [Actinomycetota bacterium]|jgi:aerobic carbon-monoxide dehydrogenase large subunit